MSNEESPENLVSNEESAESFVSDEESPENLVQDSSHHKITGIGTDSGSLFDECFV